MNKFASIIAAAALCAIPLMVAHAASQALQTKPAVLPMNGGYLSTAYLAVLEKTKSHKKAWATASPQGFVVSRDKRGLVLDLIINWHEGTSAIFDPKNPTVNLYPEGSVSDPFTWIDTTQFKFGSGKDQARYRYVGNEQTFLMGKLLAGNYTDADGRKYVFGTDGKAQFPGRAFRYEIYTDMVFEDGDEIWDLDASKPNILKIYGFAWRGNALYLFNASCDQQSPGCAIDRKHPFAILHKAG